MRPTCLLLLALLAGCGGPEPLPLPPPGEGRPRPALAIAPILSAYQPTADRPRRAWSGLRGGAWRCGSCGEVVEVPPLACSECGLDPKRAAFAAPYRPRADLEAARRRAAELLAQRGAFADVVLLPTDADLAPELHAARRDAAQARGAGLLLELRLEDARVELLRKNAWYPLKLFDLIVGTLAIVPILDPVDGLIPGEEYGVVHTLTWRVTGVPDGSTVATGRLERVTSAAFNDFGPGPSRGYFFFGTVRTPDCLDEADWAEVHAQLAEVAAEDLATAIVLVAEDAAGPR